MEQIKAICPKCKTEYELTPEQLGIANGKVRCGACMTVFVAAEVPTAKVNDPVEDSSFDESQIDEERIQDGENDHLDIPDMFDRVLFSDDGGASPVDAFGVVEGETSEGVEDESWAEELMRELESDGQSKITPPSKADFSLKDKSRLVDSLGDIDEFADRLTLAAEDASEKEILSLSATKTDLLERISPEPIQFQYAARKKLGKRLLSGTAACLLILAAAAQFLYFHFENLSKTEPFRPFYAFACQHLGCELPSKSDVKNIQLSYLNIKPHPYLEDILVAEAVIVNQAAFEQPFPVLALVFTHDQQSIVATRALQPSDYLRGELRVGQVMPLRQPVRIAVEIADPGERANGYFVEVR